MQKEFNYGLSRTRTIRTSNNRFVGRGDTETGRHYMHMVADPVPPPPHAKLNQPVMMRFSCVGDGTPRCMKVQSDGQTSVRPFLGCIVTFWWKNCVPAADTSRTRHGRVSGRVGPGGQHCVPPSSLTSFRYVMKTRCRDAPVHSRRCEETPPTGRRHEETRRRDAPGSILPFLSVW